METLLNCFILALVSSLFHRPTQATFLGQLNRVLLGYNREYDTCKEVTDLSDGVSKTSADEACERAFQALDQLADNICHGWRLPACRKVPGDEYRFYQCTCLMSYCGDLSIKSGIITPLRYCTALIGSHEDFTRQAVVPTTNLQLIRSKYDDALQAASFRRARNHSGHNHGTGPSSKFCPPSRIDSSSGVLTKGGADGSRVKNTADHGYSTAAYPPKTEGTSGGAVNDPFDKKAGEVARPHACDKCSGRFRSARVLFQHKKNYHTIEDTHCYLCDRPYSSRKSFLAHLKKRHPKTAAKERASRELLVNPAEVEAILPYSCATCKRRFSSRSALTKHTRSHMTDDTRCRVCNQIWSTRFILKRHMESAHPGAPIPVAAPVVKEAGPNDFVCPDCGNIYHCKSSLRDHAVKHTTLDTYCIHCNLILGTKGIYKKHMKNMHPNEALLEEEAAIEKIEEKNPEKCPKCDKRFKNKRGLQDHMPFHDGKTTCENCNTIYPRKSALLSHKRKEHPI